MIDTQIYIYGKERNGKNRIEGGKPGRTIHVVSFSSLPCRKAIIWISHYTRLLFSSIKQFYPILSEVGKKKKDAAKPHTPPAWDAEMIGGRLGSTAGGVRVSKMQSANVKPSEENSS